MNKLQKFFVFWSMALLIIIMAIFFAVSINQKLNTAATTNTVSFSGTGKVLAKPDIAIINFSIVTEAATSKIAQDENSKKSVAAAEFLKGQEIEERDIKTTSYNIYPQYNYPRYDKPEIKGYQVNQGFEVKVRNLDKVSDVLDGLVVAGANQVNNLGLQIDEPEKLRNEARQKAIEDAKKKAGELKDQLDIKLGRIINFSENTGGYPIPVLYDRAAEIGIGGGGPVVPTGENEITVSVTLTYQIK